MNLIFLDTETTGLTENDRLLQVAYKLRHKSQGLPEIMRSAYFKPPVAIGFEAMATHHITNKMVENQPFFPESVMWKELKKIEDDTVFIAHNAKFDLRMLRKEGINFKNWIDTQRVAQHVLNSPKYSLQYLRYSLDLDVEGIAHDACGDVAVLEKLFDLLWFTIKNQQPVFDHTAILQHMMTLSIRPVLLEIFAFGKHEGKKFSEVINNDKSYILWLYNSEMNKIESDRNENLVFTLQHYLQIKSPSNFVQN